MYRFNRLIQSLEQKTIVRAIRNALVTMIPVLMIGAFALILQTFPVPAYQHFLETPVGSVFMTLLNLIYSATFGVMSIYMTILISYSYIKLKADRDVSVAGAVISSLISFFILAGAYLPDFSTDYLGPKSMFMAILTGLGASAIFRALSRRQNRKQVILSMGADREFNRALLTLVPIMITSLIFALFNLVVIKVADVDSFRMWFHSFMNWLFSFGAVGFLKGMAFVLLSSLLWFFGIHGSDTLEEVMQTYFVPGLVNNQAAVVEGNVPTEILTKGFFDSFVLMGGCGSAICLLIAILLFSRNRARKKLGLAAAFPMIFNINEIMVFGLPIIFNPIMFIPFILAPLVCYSVSYFAIATGLVPMITSEVAWTTPVFIGGYQATGSVAGCLLQLVNIIIGVLIYLPFIRALDRQTDERIKIEYASFLDYFRANEQTLGQEKLMELNNVHGEFARELGSELQSMMDKGITMGYQPQYNYEGKCIGAEALLRWNHPVLGTIYPPILIKLAEEGDFLIDLEKKVMQRVLEEHPAALEKFGPDAKISFNITATTVVDPHFLQFCRQMNDQYGFEGKKLCLEVTEQASLPIDEETVSALKTIGDTGLLLAIDDFSMGHTSIHYIKDNLFDIIKLDGSLISELFSHENNREIISSIVHLADTLNMTVIAEFVETEEQRDTLHQLGCDIYQGYLYSPAVFLKEQERN